MSDYGFIGFMLKVLRDELGEEAVATLAGVTPDEMRGWWKGGKRPSPEQMDRIRAAYRKQTDPQRGDWVEMICNLRSQGATERDELVNVFFFVEADPDVATLAWPERHDYIANILLDNGWARGAPHLTTLHRLLDTASANGWQARHALRWLSSPNGLLEGGLPLDLLDDPEALLDLAAKDFQRPW